jgi:hypothetical protein
MMLVARVRLTAVLSVIAIFDASSASAAVRKCGDFVAAAGEDRGAELVARQKAIAGWIESASKLGPAYSAWRLAIDKSLSCQQLADGTHRCQVLARPCGIAQAPDALPPGTDPAPPIKPKREQRT